MPDDDEHLFLAVALVQRLREGSLPPNDAYWWARVICEDVRKAQAKAPEAIFVNNPIVKLLT